MIAGMRNPSLVCRVAWALLAIPILCVGLAAPLAAQDIAGLPDDKKKQAKEDLAYFEREGTRSGLKNLKIDTKFEFPRLIVTGFSADLGSGKVSGTGRVDLFNPLGTQTMKVAYRKVPLGAYVRSYLVKWNADISGTIDADLDLTWRGITRNGAKRTMSGTGRVRYNGGTIRRASAVSDIGSNVGISRPLPLTIRSGMATGSIANGVLRIDQLRVTGATSAASAAGTVNLSTGVADTIWDLYVGPQLGASIDQKDREPGASWAGAGGRIGLPVTLAIRGNLESPSLVVEKK